MPDQAETAQVLRIPSKTFLMGEYAVLMGGQALVLSHGPFFEVWHETPQNSFHPDSPAGKLLAANGKVQSFCFSDPYKGAGGFGGSTAEFIAAHVMASEDKKNLSTQKLLESYFSYCDSSVIQPSGADLCAQALLKESLLVYEKSDRIKFSPASWPFNKIRVLIFKTQQKIKTHAHLESLENLDFSKLKETSSLAIKAFKNIDLEGFLNSIDEFTKEQALLGLLSHETMSLIVKANQLEGVLTSRGCGAMGADVFAVFVKEDSAEYIQSQIEEMGLKFVYVL